MIKKDNLEQVLLALNYVKKARKEEYYKEWINFDCCITVDFKNEKITYPEDKGMIIHRKTTCNFSEPENFVVLECITSLLDKGYKPEHIELEKPMPGGHDDTGGFCDIQVKDNTGKTFLLIECKKENEFEKFWKKTLADGDQLFRYYNSYRSAQALCLYMSDYTDENKLKRYTNIISMVDNKEYLQTDKSLKSFKDVQSENGDKEDYFKVWKETYQQDYATSGIFESDIDAYTVGKNKFTIDDLDEVDNDSIQKKYHEFATILRQHNVGSHENAFDKLINLFLAKIVDETINPSELQFYWKGAACDDYYSLQDRLQKLYKEGMEKFLGEEVTYIDQKQVSDAFHLFKNDPDATKRTVLDYFKQLKFYTNSDFAFLDVHNEELFYQNAIILKKIVKMLEDIKLKTEEQNQFLGDLFEGFLDDGVKQSEGQFFTPLPIVKFLVSSLPLEEIIHNNLEIPKAIDYACGAGHFLTEYASAIKEYIEKYKKTPVSEYYKEIYGIEKEYRLSKVSKVSAFMYGQDDIQIIYADALANNARIVDSQFKVLIANPPYSVKGFLETLSDDERANYELSAFVSDISKNNSIETFFIERAKQLLAGEGVAAIILPTSVLSNGNIYIACREIILKYFEIISIVELGSGTFGKTGTNTATLFLRRRNSNPDLSEHYLNRVTSWFDGDATKDIVFDDADYISKYCEHCNIDYTEYINWLSGSDYPNADIFNEYQKKAIDNTKYKAIKKKKITKKYTDADKEAELKSFIESFIKECEKEKLYYYLLCKNNSCPVVVVQSPTKAGKEDKNLTKAFLGYEWSGAKGSEGIKYLGVNNVESDDDELIIANKGINSINTPLFDPLNVNNPNKINYIIKENFNTGDPTIPSELTPYVKKYNLWDMLDFTRVDFDKAIRTSGIDSEAATIESKYPIVSVDKLAKISRGASPRPIENFLTEDINGVNWIKIGDVTVGEKYITHTAEKITKEGATKSRLVKPGDFIVSNSMSVGRPYILKIEGCIHDGWLLLSNISSDIDTEYFYYVLSSEIAQKQLFDSARGGVVKNLNTTRMSSIKIPLPPMPIQLKLVQDCNMIEEDINTLRKDIVQKQSDIETIANELFSKTTTSYKLSDRSIFDLSIGRRVLNKEVDDSFTIPVYSANVFQPFGFIDKQLLTDFSSPSVVWGIDGDWQVNVFKENFEFYPTDHCGVMRIKNDILLPRIAALALRIEGKKRGFKRSYRASLDRIESISIKVPDINKQKEADSQITNLENDITKLAKKIKQLESKRMNLINDSLL